MRIQGGCLKMAKFDFEPMQKRHQVVTLVGSTQPQFQELYRTVARELCLAGYLVISVNLFKTDVPNIEEYRETLESIHFQKIDMADTVVLIGRSAVGIHTRIELDYARQIGKPVFYFDQHSRDLMPLRELPDVNVEARG